MRGARGSRWVGECEHIIVASEDPVHGDNDEACWGLNPKP